VAEEPVVERGVLTAPGPVWDAAVRRAEVIGRLADKSTVGLAAVDEAADELGCPGARYMHWSRGGVLVRVWCPICCPANPTAAGVLAGCRTRSRRSCGRCCGRGI